MVSSCYGIAFWLPGMAEANPDDYEVSGTWTLEDVNGRPTIIPRMPKRLTN